MSDDEYTYTFEIVCPEIVIANEIRQGLSQRQIAEIYAMALVVRSYPIDWQRIHNSILAKWPKGLNRVKEMAWKITEQKRKEYIELQKVEAKQ